MPMPREYILGGFGLVAALILAGGWVLLRLARDRQHFQLMKAALDKGITTMPGLTPGWLISMRQGVMAMVLGAGVMLTGIALHIHADSIPPIPANPAMTRPATQNDQQPPPPFGAGQPAGEPREPRFNDRGPGGPGGPGGPDRGGPGGPNGPGPRVGPFNPQMEHWHQVRSQKFSGIIAICAGGILLMLGLVRVIFARMERKYAAELGTPARLPE